MTLKTIGLTLFSAETAEWTVPAASSLARHTDAHLIGVHAVEIGMAFATQAAFDPGATPVLIEWQEERTEVIRATFTAAAEREGISAEFRGQDNAIIGAETFLTDGLRACDLVVSPRLERDDREYSARALQEQVIRNSGRPVLVLPRKRLLGGPARHLMIGVSPTREAARAAHDALSLAAPGAKVDLVSVSREAQPVRVAFDFRQDLAAALDRHGFKVNLIDRDGRANEAGEVLLAAAEELGADLLATGAFGHSRAYDFVIGAATAHLLAHAEVPVLYSK